MKVKDLIEILEKQDPDTLVILQGDSEGNSHKIIEGHWEGVFDEEESEVGFGKLTDELKKSGYTEEDIIEGKPAIFLWG